jgi:pimeloyl-ACP methyl ester carboxylesterase
MTWVLLPGMDGTGELFAPFAANLPVSDRAIIVRYPKNEIFSENDYLHLIKKALPLDEPFLIVAESFSGSFAIEIAAQEPPLKNLRALILSATFPEPPFRGLSKIAIRTFGPIAMRIPPPRPVLRYLLLDPEASEELQNLVTSSIKSVKPNVMVSRLKILLRRNVSDLLEKIDVPILALGAENDRLISKTMTHRLAAGARCSATWLDSPHMLLQTRPAEALSAIQQFLASH